MELKDYSTKKKKYRHLKELSEFTEDEQKLIFENKKISNKKNHIDVVLGDLQGIGYNKNPNPETFLPLTNIAIKRAKSLDVNKDYPKKIGTHLYKLIEKLSKP